MGALHDGHLSLVRMAASSPLSCERIVVSIFVNPAQFAPHEDLASYPRTLPRDLELLRSLTYRSLSLTPPPGFTPDSPVVHAVIAPTVSELYPSGISTDVQEQRGAFVEVVGLSHQLEGTVRPHFFRGVATVVTKLLNAAQADVAIFGQKDAQQCCVVRRMVRDLLIPTRIVVGATSRERDGLAMSSRNAYLSPAERAVAPVLHRALAAAKDKFESGEQSAAEVVRAAREVLDAEAARTASTVGLTVQYVSLSDPETLEDLVTVAPESEGGKGGLLSAAVGIGKTRLIDNELLGFKF
ncbi:Nucleotidylyl transferase [Gonapodya prolifera JEL478]|uniref:Pantoate--beta-alanine ligase n=1 Tax=Gonapodya prolifera (strain JEL478) TaxID=1344416 RepID=A0A139AXN9_GONPJ|nr:Nucleotidylyl transferase [Gonapodya prolifera JEL478]|eukprot:KXS21498.1 Nucleotidylyl transferase [Gonapodya prolifera JEL478]